MNKIKQSRHLVAALTLIILLMMCAVPVRASVSTSSGVSKGQVIGDTGLYVTSMKSYSVAPGVEEYTINTNNDALNSQTVVNVMEVDPSNDYAKAVVAYGDIEEPIDWTMATTSDQAHLWESVTGENVVGAFNASFYNTSTGKPTGMTVIRGYNAVNSTDKPYFAAYSDGSYTIEKAGVKLEEAEATQSEKRGTQVTITSAVAGSNFLVENGEVTNAYRGVNTINYPRTAVGLKSDGTLVFFQCDGQQSPRSIGYLEKQEAAMMAELGCEVAIQLDEGGSSTFLSQREGEDDLTLRNTPTDGGERKVAATILIVSNVNPTGTFDHANITPDEEYYTPDSEVELTAVGMDFSGSLVDSMPEDVTWILEDESMGTLENEYNEGDKSVITFTSNGTAGSAVVDFLYKDAVVGTTTIHIQDPDNLVFSSNDIAITYGEKSDLGLIAYYQNEVVNLKAGDIEWLITYEEDYEAEKYPIGTFDGLIFTASDDTSISCKAEITAIYGTLSASTSVELGKEPQILADGGDTDGRTYITGDADPCMHVGSEVEDVAYLQDNFGIFSYNGRGGVSSMSLVSVSDEEYADIVRFGDKAIRIDYDWTGISGTDGACFGPGESIEVTGAPTGLGVWIYIPDENTPVPWCRLQIATSTDEGETWTPTYVNFTTKDGKGCAGKVLADKTDGSTSEEKDLQVGWNYVEADLSNFVQMGTLVRINAGMLFRAMVENNNSSGWKTVNGTTLDKADLTGYILFDNLCFVYGVNNQDTTNPQVISLSFEDEEGITTEIEDGMTVYDNTLNFHAVYDDYEDTDPFAKGVDLVNFYIDGNNVGAGVQKDQGSTLSGITLANGEHSVTLYLRDGYGNVTRETRTFIVEGEEEYPGFTLSVNGEPTVNSNWTLSLMATHPEEITEASFTVAINNRYPVKEVKFAEGVEGTWDYNESTGTLTITIESINLTAVQDRLMSDEAYEKLADIVVNIPKAVEQGSSITVQVTKGTYQTSVENLFGSFSTASRSYAIYAAYILTTDYLIVGTEGTIYVQKAEGEPAVGVTVYWEETQIGVSNEEGVLTTKLLTEDVGTYILYAVDDEDNWSYETIVSSYKPAETEDSRPYNIAFNISKDEATMQNISWMSSLNAEAKAEILYSTNQDLTESVSEEGTSALLTYSTDGFATRVNNVQLTDLTPDTTYYFQVGDGQDWSEVKTFSTGKRNPDDVNFFVMADIQEEGALIGFSAIADVISNSGKEYDFGVQTGDAVDNPRSYAEWMDTMNLFTLDAWEDTDWLHVLGNHDIDDYENKDKAAKTTFGITDDYYSVEYGDVYIAVMNYTTEQEKVEEFGKWLVEDASESDCTWKFVFSHSSVYYTNDTSEAEMYQRVLPSYLQEAGINFYMSGHDHSYSRTYPMIDGEVKDDGIVYWICGTTGGKSYNLIPDSEEHFAIATLDFNSVYLDISTHKEREENTITITAYNVASDGSVSVLDFYSDSVEFCENGNHDYVWDRETDELTCKNCPFVSTMEDERLSDFVWDAATGRLMYLVAGQLTPGIVSINNVVYYFDEEGLAYEDGTYTFCGETCTILNGTVVSWDNEHVLGIGMAGYDIGYVVYDDGTMYLDGNGAMWDFADRAFVPWLNIRSSIKNVTVGADISSIGAYSFYECTNLSTITFEEGSVLQEIANYAFHYTGLNSVILPEGVTAIGNRAFEYNSKLTYIYIPNSVSSISNNVFANSSNVVLDVGYESYAKQYAVNNEIAYTERLTDCEISLAFDSCVYNGIEQTPEIAILFNSEVQDLVLDTDYKVEYNDHVNVGTAKVTVSGINSYTGTLEAEFTIVQADLGDLSEEEIILSYEDKVYDGTPKEPKVSLTYGNLVEGTDYVVGYFDNINAGEATIIVAGINNCTGLLSTKFTIEAADIADLTNVNVDLAYESCEYDGNAKKPDVTVTYGEETQELTEGTDYRVEYSNNVDAGTATVAVAGINNYTGTLTATFTIEPTKLTSAEMTLAYDSCIYDGEAKTPEVTVTYGEKSQKLAEESDYTVIYSNNVDAGAATVTVTGINNYTGTLTAGFTIKPMNIEELSEVKAVLAYDNSVYDGKAKNPEVTVTYGEEDQALVQGTDYTIEYSNNVNAGTATVTVTGINNYTGTLTVEFTIEAADIAELADVKAALEYETCEYDGNAKKPDVTVTYGEETQELTEGTDYRVAYSDNVDAGTATVTVTGINNYKGTLTAEFAIEPADIAKLTGAELILAYESCEYDGNAKKPDVTVTYGEETQELTDGTDYSVAYSNNVDAGTATVTVAGINNYTGTLTAMFTIEPAEIEKLTDVKVNLAYDDCEYDGEAKEPEVTVTFGEESQTLTEGKDYTVEYGSNVNLGTATVTVTGINNFTGTLTSTFTIEPADIENLMNVTVKVDPDRYTYDGEVKEPQVTVTYGEEDQELAQGTDYTVEYSNNVNAGTATITVAGINNYTGTLTVEFTIEAADIADLTDVKVALEYETCEYDGNAKKPDVTVTYGEETQELTEGTDYRVAYSNNVDAGTATVTVTGINNYTGTLTAEFNIERAALEDSKEYTIELEFDTCIYDGTAKEPEITLTYGGESYTLKEGIDYRVEYSDDIDSGTVTVTIIGINNYFGTLTTEFTIEKANFEDLPDGTVALAYDSCTYDGTEKEPEVTLTYGSLTEGIDYTVEYLDNVNAGTAKVVVTGINNCMGTMTAEFSIEKADQLLEIQPESSSISEGDTLQINVSGAEGSVIYSSEEETIATVDEAGLVTGISAGTTVITVTAAETENYKEKSIEVSITVIAAESEPVPEPDESESQPDEPEPELETDETESEAGPEISETDENKTIEKATVETTEKTAAASVESTSSTTTTKLIQLRALGGNKRITLKWNKVNNADGYLIYGTRCGHSYELIANLEDGTAKKYVVEDLEKGKSYKFRVKAYSIENGSQKILKSSNIVHVYTHGNKKYGNAKKVTVKANEVTLSAGETRTISASITMVNSKKKLTTHVKDLRYRSNNKKVATVSTSGKITAVKSGSCSIYVYSPNGRYAKVKVTVK